MTPDAGVDLGHTVDPVCPRREFFVSTGAGPLVVQHLTMHLLEMPVARTLRGRERGHVVAGRARL